MAVMDRRRTARIGDRYPTRVADRPVIIDRAEPTVWSPRASWGTAGLLSAGELDALHQGGSRLVLAQGGLLDGGRSHVIDAA